MSRHIARSDRWQRMGPLEMRSDDGLVVRFFKRAWWAEVAYRVLSEEPGAAASEEHMDRLGPFKRPRNAMVEAERHETMLRNRFGTRIAFGSSN
jgi:hypothetical protein